MLLKAGQNLFRVIQNMVRKCEACIALQKGQIKKSEIYINKYNYMFMYI